MALDLAALENSIADDALEAESAEGEETSEETTSAEGEEKPEKRAEGEETAETEAEPDESTPIKIGEETLTLKELKDGSLRQADYTRKTQALAAEREAFESERDTLHEENEELKAWVSSLSTVEDMEFELERFFPDQYEALRQRIIEQAIEEQEMSEREREAHRRAHKAELAERARKKDEELDGKKRERTERVQRTATLRQTFNGWLEETLTASGLDPANAKHMKLVRQEIASEHKGKTWTKEIFEAAAKEVAGVLGAKPKAAPSEKKPEVPPTRVGSAKAPASKEKKAKKKSEDSENFFEKLRSGQA